MVRKWQDISREVDDIAKDVLWAPDTPPFLEARAQRQATRERPPASYTQARTAIHQSAPKGRRSFGAAASRTRPGGGATIIDFEDLGRAGVQGPSRQGQTGRSASYYGGRGGYRYPVDTRSWGDYPDDGGRRRASAYGDWREDAYGDGRSARRSVDGRARSLGGTADSRSRRRGGVSGDMNPRSREERGSYRETQWSTRYEDENAPEGFDGEAEEDTRLSLRGRLDKLRHDARRRKADRDFAHNFEDAPTGEEGPRAAVYKGKMGRSHQRSARMQARGSQARASGGWALPSIPLLGFLLGKRPLAAAVFSVLCLALFAAVVFPGVQDYYLQMRTNAQLEAEYQAVLQRNEELQHLVSTLQTDEGIEQLAHESLGWVREGEQSVSVMADGSSDIGSGTTVDSSSIPSGSVPAPTTWYSPALDALFGYEG